jgi:hypothetical protein
MHPQLQAVADEFTTARERLHRLAATVPAERWAERPSPEGWSPAECVAHLNLTSEAYLPLLRDALQRARARGGPAPARHRHGLIGWLLWRTMGPGQGMKVKTVASMVPNADAPRGRMLAEFERLQDEQIALVGQADGLPVSKVKIPSPFAARMKYDAYSALTILPRHQHRHLDQAERAWAAVSARE